MKVRMMRFVGSFVDVRDLEPGEVYDLSESKARQFIDNGMAEPADEEDSRLEAAALRAPRRRG